MDKLQMAKVLLSNPRYSNPGQTTTAYGIATSDSADGLVMVDLGGNTVSVDDDQSVECETTFKVYEGDDVIVSLVGADGTAKTPTIIGVVGRGDEQQTEIDKIKNYFWTNDRGAHVSTIEQSVEGANVLLDADSLDIRIGGSNSEDDQTVVAKFGRDTAYVSGIDGTKYWRVKDLRNVNNEMAIVTDIRYGDGRTTYFKTDFQFVEVLDVTVNDVTPYEVTSSQSTSMVKIIVMRTDPDGGTVTPRPPKTNDVIKITYTTQDPVFSYDEGIRQPNSSIGAFSKIQGFLNSADGSCATAFGYKTEANGFYSSAEGYNTVANGFAQKVIGKYNVEDSENKYVFIAGNGKLIEDTPTEDILSDTEADGYSLEHTAIKINSAKIYGSVDISDLIDHIEYVDVSADDDSVLGYWLYLTETFDEDIPIRYTLVSTQQSFYYKLPKDTNYIVLGELSGPVSESNSKIEVACATNGFLFDYTYDSTENQLTVEDPGSPYVSVFYSDGRIDNIMCYPSYLVRTFDGFTIRVEYICSYLDRNNALNVDWDGNIELGGEMYLGGCEPNGESPQPAVRFNELSKNTEYFNGANWIGAPGLKLISEGFLEKETTNRDIVLPQESMCILFTYEYNASTFAYRGHHAYLLYVPKSTLYGTTAISSVNLAASTNSGVTVTRPDSGLLQIKCYSATYAVQYRVYSVMQNIEKYTLPLVSTGLLNDKMTMRLTDSTPISVFTRQHNPDLLYCKHYSTSPAPAEIYMLSTTDSGNSVREPFDLSNYSNLHLELSIAPATSNAAPVKVGFANVTYAYGMPYEVEFVSGAYTEITPATSISRQAIDVDLTGVSSTANTFCMGYSVHEGSIVMDPSKTYVTFEFSIYDVGLT